MLSFSDFKIALKKNLPIIKEKLNIEDISTEDAKVIFHKLNTSGTGYINYSEFIAGMIP